MKSERPKGNGEKRERLALPVHGKEKFLSHEPTGSGALIGQSLAELSDALKASTEKSPFEVGITSELLKHNAENVQYIEEKRLEKISCPHALKKWTFERMSQLNVPYEMNSRLKPRDIEENADERATLKLLDLAEDFLQISSFCRKIQAMQIEMAPHGAGMEFLFEFMGTCESIDMRTIEDKGLNLLFKKFSKENSMRLRSNVAYEFVEIQAVVFRKKLRLGMSPEE